MLLFLKYLPTYFLFHFLDDYRVMHVTREEADEVISNHSREEMTFYYRAVHICFKLPFSYFFSKVDSEEIVAQDYTPKRDII
jgi:hypothetical protein